MPRFADLLDYAGKGMVGGFSLGTWGNTRAGSSPTFGAEIGYLFSTTRTPLGAASEVVPSKLSRIWLMTPVKPSRFREGTTECVRITEKVTREDIFGGVHTGNLRPEQPGADFQALEVQS